MNIFPQAPATARGAEDARAHAIVEWLRDGLGLAFDRLVPASGDASFRRYFRIEADGASMIVMDAPPSIENVGPFIDIARLMEGAGVHVPQVLAVDAERGFALLGDLGTLRYQDRLDTDTADGLYRDAIAALVQLQQSIRQDAQELPPYDEGLLRRELGLFREWFLERDCGIRLSLASAALYEAVTTLLVDSALQQPQVFVHRDYHSRNLMVCREGNPGILDFQDAVWGPITYDLVSLLRDCYIKWPDQRVERWLGHYVACAREAGLTIPDDPVLFRRWFDLMGMQRHLKAIGIFSRLALRDGKHGYLDDIPRTMGYVMAVCERYPELAGFSDFLHAEVSERSRGKAAA